MIDDLKAFAAVMESSSIAEACQQLFITQSAASRRLQHLEEILGTPLMDRSQRPLAPTALGVRILPQVKMILRAIDDLVAMASEDAAPQGMLRLGMPPALGDSLPITLVTNLKAKFPDLGMRLRTDWGKALSEALTRGELDAAFLLLPRSAGLPKPLIGRAIAQLEIVVVQSAIDRRFEGPLHLADLAEADWVLNPVGCGYRASLEQAMGREQGTLRVAVDTFGTEKQLGMVASGLGVGLVPRAMLDASPMRSSISIIDVTDFALPLDIWMASVAHLGNLKRVVDSIATAMSEQFV